MNSFYGSCCGFIPILHEKLTTSKNIIHYYNNQKKQDQKFNANKNTKKGNNLLHSRVVTYLSIFLYEFWRYPTCLYGFLVCDMPKS